MRCKSIYKAALAAAFVLCGASAARANFLFGSFEGSNPDGFGSWSGGSGTPANSVVPFDTGGAPNATYSYSSLGATNGSVALSVDFAGFAQDLAYDFVANGNVAQFKANDVLSFDVTFPAGTPASTSGFSQVFSVALNSQGGGFVTETPTPTNAQAGYFTSRPVTTFTVSFNYDAYKANVVANPSNLQMIIANNNGTAAPTDIHFDNFQLSSVPEPTTCSLLGIGAISLIGRRRRR